MLIIICILGELITIGLTLFVTTKGILDVTLEIPKNGYKIDKRVIEDYQRKQKEAIKEKTNILSKILGIIIFLTPGVNVLKVLFAIHKCKKEVMNNQDVKKALVPMTDEEKKQYSKLEGYFERLAYSSFVIDNDEEEQEFIGIAGDKVLVCDHGLTSIYYDELLPLDYTLDEVKRLNEVSGYSYRIGKVDGKNVAIIGIPNSKSLFSRLQFKSENYDTIHDYESMIEEEAQDETFTVYPFTIKEENQEDLNRIVEEIKQSRIDSATKANLDALNVYHAAPGVEIGYVESDVSSEDMMSSMEDNIFENNTKDQGPSLRKHY